MLQQISSILHVAVALLVFQAIIYSKQEKCAVLEIYHLNENSLAVSENRSANVMFGMNTSSCRHSNTPYKVKVQTRTSSGSLEYGGTVTYLRDTCTSTPNTSVRCISPTGPAELNRKVNRSHVAVEWTWLWKDTRFSNFTAMEQKLQLIVTYPPSVTSLTVNGQDVNGNHFINEDQEVNISCLIDKGNPPAIFRLLDEHGTEINSFQEEQYLVLSLTTRFKEDWPTVRCEGNSSVKNRSVSFLVSCLPQFTEKRPKFTVSAEHELWTVRVKAHTREIEKCLVMPLSLGGNKNIDVNCSLTGNPPDLLLIVLVNKEDSTRGDQWALSFRNEKGSSDTLVFNKHLVQDAGVCIRVSVKCFITRSKTLQSKFHNLLLIWQDMKETCGSFAKESLLFTLRLFIAVPAVVCSCPVLHFLYEEVYTILIQILGPPVSDMSVWTSRHQNKPASVRANV